MVLRNTLGKPAQFSFAADLFMMQAILKSEGLGENLKEREYAIPLNCYRQIFAWLLSGAKEIGLAPFDEVATERTATEVRITFPSKSEEDRLHRFFELFNQKRRQAQGVDASFPPMPDIYQGTAKPVLHVIERYLAFIEGAFDGEVNVVPVPIGPKGAEFDFEFA